MVPEMSTPNTRLHKHRGPEVQIVISSHERERVGQTVGTLAAPQSGDIFPGSVASKQLIRLTVLSDKYTFEQESGQHVVYATCFFDNCRQASRKPL
jgi:hypothetical protein